jgi:hypothetical protein
MNMMMMMMMMMMMIEHNYISNKWYLKYQLHVSASILAIARLYSTYQVTIQYVCGVLWREGGVPHPPPEYTTHILYSDLIS